MWQKNPLKQRKGIVKYIIHFKKEHMMLFDQFKQTKKKKKKRLHFGHLRADKNFVSYNLILNFRVCKI